MQFNSIDFIKFLVVILAAYYVLPHRFRWLLLLAGSLYFYMSGDALFVVILIFSIAVDYVCGIKIGAAESRRDKRNFLALSLFTNLGLLFVFKYFDFFSASVQKMLLQVGISLELPVLEALMPLGISYFTLKKIGYIIDVYHGSLEAEKHLGRFALYVSFFPEIVAGPIDRARDLLPQFRQKFSFDYQKVTGGLKLMAWGMFKKVVIADRLALFVDQVYNEPTAYNGLSLILATLFFSIQIYCDFSGYSDIAIGIGQVLGLKICDNFDRPYSARSIGDFWKRWHISLTNWLRDYLFLPAAYALSRRIKRPQLLGIKAEMWAYAAATLGTMLLCGLWHGPAWTFVLWGGLHGLFLVVSVLTRKLRKKIKRRLLPRQAKPVYNFARMGFTFLVVSFLWIFFRARSLSDALYIIGHLFSGLPDLFSPLPNWPLLKESLLLGQAPAGLLIPVLAAGFMVFIHIIQPHETMRSMFAERPLLVRWALYLLIVLAIMNLGRFNETPFIYAQY